jgi:uncharacterized DUF497 family protein
MVIEWDGLVKFEWDEAKNQANVVKHALDFEDAKSAFFDLWALTLPDNRRDYGENRFILIGQSDLDTLVLVVVYTVRHHHYRIISARRANAKERKAYDDQKKSHGL